MDDKFLEDLERTTLAENGQLDWRLELRGMAKNTRINYMSRLGFFDKYMRKQWPGHPPEAPSDKMLAHFLIMEFIRGLAASGLKASVNAVNWRATVLDHVKPAGARTRRNLKRLRALSGREGRGRGQAPSLTLDQVHNLIQTTIEARDSWSFRDAALISTCYYGMLRISEAVSLDRDDVTFLDDGRARLFIRQRKNDQEAKGSKITLPEDGAELLRAWLDSVGITSGPLFRGVRPARSGPNIGDSNLSREQAQRIVQGRAKDAKLGHITTHSLRRSHARHLKEAGASLVEIQHAGGWRSTGMPALYSGHDEAQGDVMQKFYPVRPRLRRVK